MMQRRFVKRLFILISILILLSQGMSSSFDHLKVYASSNDSYTKEELTALAKGVVAWRMSAFGLAENSDLVASSLSTAAGSTESDWFVIAMARMGLPGAYSHYLSSLTKAVEERYQSASKLSVSKATEWHRIALAILACSGDPTAVGGNINLIADGTYNRGWTKPLENQGNNGPIYALIAMDAMNYNSPSDAYESRRDILGKVLDSQLADGGFAQSGLSSDVDMTAMALTSLAPYAAKYPEAVNKGISLLSKKQTSDGGFSSGGVENAESTSQVIIALTSLGINPQTDGRFIKEGNSPVDALIGYVAQSGGIRHTADGPENDMAAQQALCAIAALVRQMNGQSGLYRFTSETPFLEEDEAQNPILSEDIQEITVSVSTTQNALTNVLGNNDSTSESEDENNTIDNKIEPDASKLALDGYGLALVLATLSVLCFLLAFKLLKGRKRDRLFLLGFVFALAAAFFLAKIETVEAHYNKGEQQSEGKTVVLSINCSTIYDHWDELDDALKNGEYLPEDGVILKQTEYTIGETDTVFDVLSLAVLENHIQIDYQGGNENVYDTVYIMGLSYLYEFSCGELSGWTYTVNGDFPDVGASSYTLWDGDVIEWLYTCDLGRDVGNVWEENL